MTIGGCTPWDLSVNNTPCYVEKPRMIATNRTMGDSITTGGTGTPLIDNMWDRVYECTWRTEAEEKEKEDKMKILDVVKNGQFRLDMNGRIAVKTNSGYKAYNLKKNRLVNCDNFVFDIGDEWFFTIPTTHVKVGDIILVNDTPKCVIKTSDDTITVLNYKTSVIEEILPERHVFMGNSYLFVKVVSMFANKDKGFKSVAKWMLMSKMFKGSNATFSPMMLCMLNGDTEDMFEGLFDEWKDDDEEED